MMGLEPVWEARQSGPAAERGTVNLVSAVKMIKTGKY